MNFEDVLPKLHELVADFGVNILSAIVIFVIGLWVTRGLRGLTRRAMEKAKVDAMLASFISHLVYFAMLTFVVLAAVNRLGVQTTSFIAVLGAAGLAVGLALQGSLSNLASGVLIILFRPYKVGDFVDGGGVEGTVSEVQIFTTVLKSPDNKRIIVPNSHMMGGTITNYSAMPQRRIDLVVGVSYSADLDQVRRVLMEILDSDERVLKDPAPVIGVVELADSSVNFVVRPWTESPNYWPLRFDLNERIKKRFDAEGIGIPFPQRDVHIYEHKSD